MIDDDGELYTQVLNLLDGDDGAWIKRIHFGGYLTAIELLALIFFAVSYPKDSKRDPKKIISTWSALVTKSVRQRKITPRDYDDRRPIALKNAKGWDWPLYSLDAVGFFNFYRNEIARDYLDIVNHLFEAKFPEEAKGEIEADKTKQGKDGLSPDEIDSLLQLTIAMAIRGYGYNPLAKKNAALSVIRRDMEFLTIPMDDTTIRKYLNMAKARNPGLLQELAARQGQENPPKPA